MNKLKIVAAFAAILASSAAHAGFIIVPARCAPDTLPQWSHDLDPGHNGVDANPNGTARGRNAWLQICDPMRYSVLNPAFRQIGIAGEFDPTTKVHTRWYPTFGVIAGQAPDGTLLFTRPGVSPSAPNQPWMAPTAPPPSVGDAACKLPGDYEFVGICASGCVTPESEVTTTQGELAIDSFEHAANPAVYVPGVSKSGQMTYDPIKVRAFTHDMTDAEQKILVIRTQSGGSIRVSTEHPLLAGDFKMHPAEKLKTGDALVRANGKPDPIIDIQTEQYFGKVHNLVVDTQNMQKSLFIVQGFVSGDKKYQDLKVSDMNRRFFRDLVRK